MKDVSTAQFKLQQLFMPCFFCINTERVYNETLESVKQSFPQYISELQGIADGSQVEFYKVSTRYF